MMRDRTVNSQARSAPRAAPVVARALLGATVTALSVLAVLVAAGAVPALAAQHPGGPAASHASAGARQRPATGRMSPGPRWAGLATGANHTCGTRADGTLWCWGSNQYGELGLGNHVSQDRPRQVTTPAAGGWARIATGELQTCAIRTGGTLWCWGDNEYGELGLGNHTSQDRPRQVTRCTQPRAQPSARQPASPPRHPVR
jgi:hypothetical protein